MAPQQMSAPSSGWQPLHQHEPCPASPLACIYKQTMALISVYKPSQFQSHFKDNLDFNHGRSPLEDRVPKAAQTTPVPPFTPLRLSPRLPSSTKAARGGEKRGAGRRHPGSSRPGSGAVAGDSGPGPGPACPLPTPTRPRHEADGGSTHAAGVERVGRRGWTEGYPAWCLLLPPFLLLLLAGQRDRHGAGDGREAAGSGCERDRRLSSDVGAFPRRRLNWHTELEGVPRSVPPEPSRAGYGVRELLSGYSDSKPREDRTERGPH